LCSIVQNILQIDNYITTISQTTTTFKLQFVFTIRQKYSPYHVYGRTTARDIHKEIHSRINRGGVGCSYITAPYICGKFTEMYYFAMLKDNAEFHVFCLKRWRQQTLVDDLLCQRKTPEELNGMSSVEKQTAFYRCSLEFEYGDTVEPRYSSTEWLYVVELDDCKDVSLPLTWFHCVRYFKFALVVNDIYKMSSYLFDAALNFDAGALDFAACPDAVADGLANVVLPTSLLGLDNQRLHTLFEVVNLAQEARTTMKVNHMSSFRVFITISVLDILVTQSSGLGRLRVITNVDRDVLKTLDVRALVCNIGAAIQSLFRWSLFRWSLFCHSERAAQLVAGSRHSSDLYPPAAIVEAGGLGLGIPRQAVALASETDSAETLARVQLWSLDAVVDPEGGSVLFENLIGVYMETLNAFVPPNAVQLHRNEFREVMVASNPVVLVVSASLIREEPVHLVRTIDASDPLRCTKVSLLFAFHQSVWQSSALFEGGHARGDPVYYSDGLQQPLSSFSSLVLIDIIFEKGVQCIYHCHLDAHYKCLLNLSRAAFPNLLPIMRDQNITFFKTHLICRTATPMSPMSLVARALRRNKAQWLCKTCLCNCAQHSWHELLSLASGNDVL
jgi:hypothetical protein